MQHVAVSKASGCRLVRIHGSGWGLGIEALLLAMQSARQQGVQVKGGLRLATRDVRVQRRIESLNLQEYVTIERSERLDPLTDLAVVVSDVLDPDDPALLDSYLRVGVPTVMCSLPDGSGVAHARRLGVPILSPVDVASIVRVLMQPSALAPGTMSSQLERQAEEAVSPSVDTLGNILWLLPGRTDAPALMLTPIPQLQSALRHSYPTVLVAEAERSSAAEVALRLRAVGYDRCGAIVLSNTAGNAALRLQDLCGALRAYQPLLMPSGAWAILLRGTGLPWLVRSLRSELRVLGAPDVRIYMVLPALSQPLNVVPLRLRTLRHFMEHASSAGLATLRALRLFTRYHRGAYAEIVLIAEHASRTS